VGISFSFEILGTRMSSFFFGFLEDKEDVNW